MATPDIYQRIYTADITQSSGLPAVLPKEARSEEAGYVVVNEHFDPSSGGLFPEIRIPESKKRSYEIVSALFDNYELAYTKNEVVTPEESAEIAALLDFVIPTPPMKLAREFIAEQGAVYTDEAWKEYVKEVWFRPFELDGSPTHTGFEHVFVSESGEGKVHGLHWWYYFVSHAEKITHKGTVYGSARQGVTFPEVVTLSYDLETAEGAITKPVGGLFVGLSVEGVMAMAMARANTEMGIAKLEGAEVELRLYKSADQKSLVTFYPIFKRVIAIAAPASSTQSPTAEAIFHSGVRIISALPNPAGSDAGHENVSLINLGEATNLMGWKVVAPNKSALVFGDVTIGRAEAMTFGVPAKGSLQLGNSGGVMKLVEKGGGLVHQVEYAKDVARIQGGVALWNLDDKLVNAFN